MGPTWNEIDNAPCLVTVRWKTVISFSGVETFKVTQHNGPFWQWVGSRSHFFPSHWKKKHLKKPIIHFLWSVTVPELTESRAESTDQASFEINCLSLLKKKKKKIPFLTSFTISYDRYRLRTLKSKNLLPLSSQTQFFNFNNKARTITYLYIDNIFQL